MPLPLSDARRRELERRADEDDANPDDVIPWEQVKARTRGDAMSTAMKEMGIDRMTPAERINLALDIWESLGADRPAGRLSPEQRAELDRRDAELEADPGLALTWEQIRANIEAGR